eukprot:g42031.t1
MATFDLTKAYATVNWKACWSILLRFVCTMKSVAILHLLDDNMEVMVMTNDSTTDPLPVQTSVKQGCVIAPVLFLIYLAAMLHLTTDKTPAGVELTYRTCGKLFNLHHLQAKTKP